MTLDDKVRYLLREVGVDTPDPASDYLIQRMPDGSDALVHWDAGLPIPMPSAEILVGLDTDPAFLRERKRRKRDAINREAERIILARWPLAIQSSVNAGLYPALTPVMAADIAAVVAASNTARDALFGLGTLAQVEACDPVNDPAWPAIGVYTQQEPV